jgi:chloride channel protein, CIC family
MHDTVHATGPLWRPADPVIRNDGVTGSSPVLGAQLGLFFGQLCQLVFPDLNIQPEGFAVVGMAAFFIGVVRAPLTGIVLVVEMTANVTMLLPMLGACFMAMLVPIYDSLRELILERERTRLRQAET